MKIQVAESKDWRKKESHQNMLCSDRNPIDGNKELSYGGWLVLVDLHFKKTIQFY